MSSSGSPESLIFADVCKFLRQKAVIRKINFRLLEIVLMAWKGGGPPQAGKNTVQKTHMRFGGSKTAIFCSRMLT